MPLELAIALSALASAALSTGLYIMKVRAAALPSLGAGFRWRAWLAFVQDVGWLSGLGLQVAGYALYFFVLRFAPLSLVHAALTGGLVLFLLLSVFVLGERAGAREWLGGLAVIGGLVCLGLSVEDEGSASPTRVELFLFTSSCIVLAALAVLMDRRPNRAIGTSLAAGFILGLAGVFAKLVATASSVPEALQSSALWLALGTNIGGFALMQAALQNGRGVVVAPIFALLSDLVPIAAGLIIFHEGLPDDPAAATLRLCAFALALGGAAALATSAEAQADPTQPTARS